MFGADAGKGGRAKSWRAPGTSDKEREKDCERNCLIRFCYDRSLQDGLMDGLKDQDTR